MGQDSISRRFFIFGEISAAIALTIARSISALQVLISGVPRKERSPPTPTRGRKRRVQGVGHQLRLPGHLALGGSPAYPPRVSAPRVLGRTVKHAPDSRPGRAARRLTRHANLLGDKVARNDDGCQLLGRLGQLAKCSRTLVAVMGRPHQPQAIVGPCGRPPGCLGGAGRLVMRPTPHKPRANPQSAQRA